MLDQATESLSSLGPTPVAGPSHPVTRDAAQWIKGWVAGKHLTKAHVRQLIDRLAGWDHMPCCLLSKDLLLQDFDAGIGRYCSPALVHALLALATRIIIETNDESGTPPDGRSESKRYFDVAEAVIQVDGGAPSRLPDIQALGVLSLYQISCGLETESEELAEACFVGISKLYPGDQYTGNEDTQYTQVCATTYGGAVSLVR